MASLMSHLRLNSFLYIYLNLNFYRPDRNAVFILDILFIHIYSNLQRDKMLYAPIRPL